MSDIWDRRSALEDERRTKMQEAMAEYDKTVYYPAMKALREECKLEGHTFGSLHNNGLGWTWFYCGKCAGRYNIVGPDGEE